MDWKTFIAEIVNSVAWPLVVIFIVYQLKDRIAELLPRLKKLKHKDTELEFEERLNDLANESNIQQDNSIKKTPEFNEQFNFLLKLAEISPRSAVIESFRILEIKAAKTIARTYEGWEKKKIINPIEIQKLLKNKILDSHQFHQYCELRHLRNQAAHIDDYNLKGMHVEAYIDIALSLVNYLENINNLSDKTS